MERNRRVAGDKEKNIPGQGSKILSKDRRGRVPA